MKVVLVRKLAEVMDGVDLSEYRNGDIVDLPTPAARLLVAESWAVPDRRHTDIGSSVERRQLRTPPPKSGTDHTC
jgi:hypothetical protein